MRERVNPKEFKELDWHGKLFTYVLGDLRLVTPTASALWFALTQTKKSTLVHSGAIHKVNVPAEDRFVYANLLFNNHLFQIFHWSEAELRLHMPVPRPEAHQLIERRVQEHTNDAIKA